MARIVRIDVNPDQIQEAIYSLFQQSETNTAEALKILSFVMARIIYSATQSQDGAKLVIPKLAEGILTAYQVVFLAESENGRTLH